MFINNIKLDNFRNIENLSLSFDNSINILYGENGQGKTNIAEAIYLLANASSFRTSYFKEMIKNDRSEACVSGNINNSRRINNFKISLRKEGKQAYIDDIQITKFSEYIGKASVICFSPEDVSLFKDSPSVRRSFLDKELSSLFPVYIKQLIVFKNILNQRNDLLKQNIDYDLLDVIDDKLIESSYDVYKRRKWLIEKISSFATTIYKSITDEDQKIEISYRTYLNIDNKDEYLSKAKKMYKDFLKKDLEKKFTIYGIHKDDFIVTLNGMQIDMYASQGQQRLISLCMKLAVAEIVNKANKSEPIIILDDAFSELDLNKKKKLFKYVSNKQQVFITCTDYRSVIDKINQRITLLHIKEGKVVERRDV